MRIYQPQNELGQALLNEGQLVSVAKTLTKELTNGTIVLNSSDIPDIDSWNVSSVRVSIGGSEFSFTPEVSKGTGSISLIFSKDRFSDLGFDKASIILQRTDSRGIVEEEVNIDVLIASGDITKIDAYVDKVIATGDVEQIQSLGAKLAASGIEEYTLAGAKTGDEVVALVTSQNMGAFSSPIAHKENAGTWDERLKFNDTTFSYNLMSLEDDFIGDYKHLFGHSNITHFKTDMPCLKVAHTTFANGPLETFEGNLSSLTNGYHMFDDCSKLTSFTSELSSLIVGGSMFHWCRSLSSFTSDLPSLTNGQGMFEGCDNLTSFTSSFPSLTNASGMFQGCTGLTSWTVALPQSLTNASLMFYNCKGLTSWTVALPQSLKNASNMFYGCKLNLSSVQKIAETIPTMTDGKSHSISIGMGCTQSTFNDHSTGWYDAVEAIKNKGWTVVLQYQFNG